MVNCPRLQTVILYVHVFPITETRKVT